MNNLSYTDKWILQLLSSDSNIWYTIDQVIKEKSTLNSKSVIFVSLKKLIGLGYIEVRGSTTEKHRYRYVSGWF